jgi:hypothetical protein
MMQGATHHDTYLCPSWCTVDHAAKGEVVEGLLFHFGEPTPVQSGCEGYDGNSTVTIRPCLGVAGEQVIERVIYVETASSRAFTLEGAHQFAAALLGVVDLIEGGEPR